MGSDEEPHEQPLKPTYTLCSRHPKALFKSRTPFTHARRSAAKTVKAPVCLLRVVVVVPGVAGGGCNGCIAVLPVWVAASCQQR